MKTQAVEHRRSDLANGYKNLIFQKLDKNDVLYNRGECSLVDRVTCPAPYLVYQIGHRTLGLSITDAHLHWGSFIETKPGKRESKPGLFSVSLGACRFPEGCQWFGDYFKFRISIHDPDFLFL